MQAMDRKQMESALTGLDANLLEMLSEHIQVDPPRQQSLHERPKGRPEFVPGAMNYATLVKFRERQDVLEAVNQATGSTVSEAEYAAIAPYLSAKVALSTTASRNVAKEAKTKAVKGERQGPVVSSAAGARDTLPTTPVKSATALKKRKRVVKNLPTPRQRNEESSHETKRMIPKRGQKANGLDLQKYYRTELLNADEEYSLGMKVQFMMMCEQVHEGLSDRVQRLPSMVEWASACGFKKEDPTFLATEADEQLRPAGAEGMFKQRDPSTFVGNGQVGTAGPGRGRGRTQKPPSTKLNNFYDDSEFRAKLRAKDIDVLPDERKMKPINRGTPTEFVEMLMTAREAKQRMVQSNMRLVVSIARKYSNVGVSLQDLVQEGSLGLSRAAEKFEPTKGFKFSTYASWWIQQAVFRSIAYHSRTIRLPVHIHNMLNRIHKVKNALQGELARAPTNEEIAEVLGMTSQKYNKMLRLTKRSISLETPKYQSNPKDLGHESDDNLGDTISASSVLSDETTPEKRVNRSLFYKDLMEMLTILEDDERRVISARYGLVDGLTRTVTAVAAEMRVSKAWVRSQECRALRKLRRPWYEKKLKEHEDALSSD
jgi:RNA polymerase sigma factor (sigma-70 family)